MKNLSVINDNLDIATKKYVDDSIGAISIPTKVSDLTNDSGYITGITSSDVTTALGYTPYSSANPNGYTSNVGTITGITMNGSSKGTSGVVNLGTVLTSHQDISGKVDTSNTLSSYGDFAIDYASEGSEPSVYMEGITTGGGQIGRFSINAEESDGIYIRSMMSAVDYWGTGANSKVICSTYTENGAVGGEVVTELSLSSTHKVQITSDDVINIISGGNTTISSTSGSVYIHDLVTPTADDDAATKKYVDDSIPTIPTVPTITLNGSSTTSPSFYAPTTTGTSGYYLKSNGSGAPTWAQVYGAQIVRWQYGNLFRFK